MLAVVILVFELRYDSSARLKEIRHVVNGAAASTAGTKDVLTTLAYTLPATLSLECPAGTIGDTEVVSPPRVKGGLGAAKDISIHGPGGLKMRSRNAERARSLGRSPIRCKNSRSRARRSSRR